MEQKTKKYEYVSGSFTYEGKRYYVKAENQRELGKKIEKKRQELESIQIYDKNCRVDEWAEKAYKTYKADKTNYYEMKLRYKNYISPAIGRKPISKVTATELQTIINDSECRSYSHLDKLIQEIKFVFKTALNDGLIVRNPAEGLSLKNIKDKTKGTRREITPEERKALNKVCDEYKPFIFFRVMLKCGLRPSEAMEIQGTDIETTENGKHLLHIRGTKTDAADRLVPIPSDLYELIKDTKPFEPICPTVHGKKHTKDSYTKLTLKLKKMMNIAMGCRVERGVLIPPYPLADDFQAYCLRHTYCSDLCRANVPLKVAQSLMGHSNISITADIYAHTNRNDIEDAGELIDNYFQRIDNGENRGELSASVEKGVEKTS